MLQLQDLSVGDVSGMIAAGIFVGALPSYGPFLSAPTITIPLLQSVQIFVPIALPIILLGLLKEKNSTATNTAVTWSVIGRFLHSSHWPTILSEDSTATAGVPTSISMITPLNLLLALLIGLAAITTPLGLYENIVPEKTPIPEAFQHVQDKSPFGYGTPPRTNLPWSRICGAVGPVSCPNSFSNVTQFSNATGEYTRTEYYDSHVPQYVIDVFESGLSTMAKSVSSIFDIQSRSYTWSQINNNPDGVAPDNGTAYPVSSFRQISSLLLDDAIVMVEGLIVDMKNGGIGFRNHSAPPLQQYGSTWSEDILFIEPETQCVDTNLTLDFTISEYTSQGSPISNLVLTDRGGFANLSLHYPVWDHNDTQNNPALFLRAYKAAWINNFWSMAFMNVTNPRNLSDANSYAFQYLKSTVGKTFPLMYNDSTNGPTPILQPNALSVSSLYGYYLSGLDQGIPGNNSSIFNSSLPGANSSFPAVPPLYSNPFNVTQDDFSIAGLLCSGAGGQDYANISNFVAGCGLMYGAPLRQDGSASLIFSPGSNWTTPLYSCISVTKALIKTVSFRFNGSGDLSGLTVTNLTDKVYPNVASKPLWGVENTELALADVKPLWGLVAPQNQGNVSLSTLRKESLYLPGYAGTEYGLLMPNYENLPGLDFHCDTLATVYNLDIAMGITDYSGRSSLAMYGVWQNLSRTPTAAAKILNLIWTDLAASSVVGTKSMETQETVQKRDDKAAMSDSNIVPVTVYHRRIQYHILYAIPAFVVLFFTLCTLVFTSYAAIFRRTGPSKMRKYLNMTSPGRILTSGLFTSLSEGSKNVSDKRSARKWINAVGKHQITLREGTDGTVIVETVERKAEGGGKQGVKGKTPKSTEQPQ